jgi:hypothetical protein
MLTADAQCGIAARSWGSIIPLTLAHADFRPPTSVTDVTGDWRTHPVHAPTASSRRWSRAHYR